MISLPLQSQSSVPTPATLIFSLRPLSHIKILDFLRAPCLVMSGPLISTYKPSAWDPKWPTPFISYPGNSDTSLRSWLRSHFLQRSFNEPSYVIEIFCSHVPLVLGISLITAIKHLYNQILIVGVLIYFSH